MRREEFAPRLSVALVSGGRLARRCRLGNMMTLHDATLQQFRPSRNPTKYARFFNWS